MRGFVKIDRKMFDSPMWRERRRFSRFEAWLDIQRRAMTYDTKGMGKGEVKLSVRRTAQEWGWGIGTVSEFLRTLINTGMLFQTDRTSVYSVNKEPNTNPNTLCADNQHSYEKVPNTNPNTSPNTLPIYIKEKKEKNARAREGESLAPGATEDTKETILATRYERFTAWLDANGNEGLAQLIDYTTFGMMFHSVDNTKDMQDIITDMAEEKNLYQTTEDVINDFKARL